MGEGGPPGAPPLGLRSPRAGGGTTPTLLWRLWRVVEGWVLKNLLSMLLIIKGANKVLYSPGRAMVVACHSVFKAVCSSWLSAGISSRIQLIRTSVAYCILL